uniref:SGTA_dimer domain-containing protein n=1 Tax=Ascaris lumbricoides TaxID=6252 RepID=A0A0M3HWF5_ASCLU
MTVIRVGQVIALELRPAMSDDTALPKTSVSNAETHSSVASSDEKNLVVSFIQFLRHKVSTNQCSDDQAEGLEVAVQCLESAFGLTDANYAFQPSKPLLDIFTAAEGLPTGETALPEPTEAEIALANKLKEEGNAHMKASEFDAAINKYNEAIKLNRDPAYFCNRAAAYCRLEQYDLAIQDCRTALALDPRYSKAYGRMGLALSCQNRYEQAVDAYKRALELDPNQESYKNNLKIAQEKVKELENAARNAFSAGAAAGAGGFPFGGGIPDMAEVLNNPAMMQMATQLMSDPNIQNLMTQMMGGLMSNASGAEGGASGISNLLQAGQQVLVAMLLWYMFIQLLAQQMQAANPELVEQLRRQFGGGNQQKCAVIYKMGSCMFEDVRSQDSYSAENNCPSGHAVCCSSVANPNSSIIAFCQLKIALDDGENPGDNPPPSQQ